MDLAALVYNPLYATFGVDASIRCLYADTFDLRAIDCTSGIAVTEGSGIDVKTIRPAAVIRMRELNERGLSREDLEDAALELVKRAYLLPAAIVLPTAAGERSALVEVDAAAFCAEDWEHLEEPFLVELSEIFTLMGNSLVFCHHENSFALAKTNRM